MTKFNANSLLNIHCFDVYEEVIEETLPIAALLCWACQYQLRNGRHFIVENPHGSDLWKLENWMTLLEDNRVKQAVLDQCMVGLVNQDKQPVQKRTRFVASDWILIYRL